MFILNDTELFVSLGEEEISCKGKSSTHSAYAEERN